jgi:hypothetical protein
VTDTGALRQPPVPNGTKPPTPLDKKARAAKDSLNPFKIPE